MAIVCLTSASGSPGVTTTAVGMAFSWPRPVLLVEADPTGGSGVLAGFLRGTTPYDAGLIELALSPLGTTDALRDVVRPLSPNVSLVAGIRSHAQATALRDIWEPLAAALRDLDDNGLDVIVDAGRLGLIGSPTPLLDAADVPNMPMNSPADLLTNPQLRATGFLHDAVHPTEGPMHAMGHPTRWSATPPAHDLPAAPRLGEHTRALLAQAGYTPTQIDALLAQGACRTSDGETA